MKMIRWTILTDTGNLSPSKKKATALDVEILERIEAILTESDCSLWSRKYILDEILKAKSDTSTFTINMLLRKDLKVHEHIFV